jgi:hypothetical protein
MARFSIAALFAVLTPLSALSADEPKDEDLNTQLMRATVKISHKESTGTGFVLTKGDRHLLVTAAHVFDNCKVNETTVVFRSNQAEGEFTREPTKLVIRKADGKPLWTKHPTEDVAVIGLVPPKNADLPSLATELLATDDQLRKNKIHPGDKLTYLGYPVNLEASKGGFPLLRDGPIASFPLLPTAKTKTFLISTNAFEEDSGGPVYLVRPGRANPDRDETRLIVGLVSGHHCLFEEDRSFGPPERIRKSHRLGFATVVHASLIRETIDLLK